MIYYLKKYWKYLLTFMIVLIIFAIVTYFKEKTNKISTKSVKNVICRC